MFPSNPSVYPEFVADQVLTAHDLNESFNYLDEQERITRTNLIGIGIVCGLQVQYDAAKKEITITKGTGVTSKGYLISVDTKKYTKAVLYDNQLKDKTYDGWFVNPGPPKAKKIDLWELKEASVDPAAFDITTAFLSDPGKEKIVLLYVELLDVKNKNCDPNSCDDKGKHYEITFRPLLVNKADALSLIGASPDTITTDTFATLSELKMRRFDVPNTSPITSQNIFEAYQSILNNTFLTDTEKALSQAYTIFKPFVSTDFPADPFSGLAAGFAFINNGSISTDQLKHIQYYYDLFSDFLLAYDEFRKTGMQILSACCPDKNLFPQHLLLGEAIPLAGNIKSSFRHYFIYSPLFEKKNLIPELKNLFKRLVLLKEKFSIPAVSSGPAGSNVDPNIRITPSKLEDVYISKKAIPYYYNVVSGTSPLYKSWNFEKTVQGIAHRNLSYHAAMYNSSDGFVINPLNYDLEPYNFLRIEGIIGKSYTKVLSNVKKQISKNRLPVDVIALNTENSKFLDGIRSSAGTGAFSLSGQLKDMDLLTMLCHFQDMESMYDAMKSEMLCMLCKELKYYYDLRFNLFSKPGTGAAIQEQVSKVGLFDYCSPGYKIKRGTLGELIERIYEEIGDDGNLTIQSLAAAFDLEDKLGDDANADGTPDNLNQAATAYLGYAVTFFEIPINIIRLANTFSSNLSSFDVAEYCRIHKLLVEKANSLKFVFNMFTASEKQGLRTEALKTMNTGANATSNTPGSTPGGAASATTPPPGVATPAETINTTDNVSMLRSLSMAQASPARILLLIFILEDFFDHLDVLIYNCKCSAFKAMKAEYLKRVTFLTLLRQFGYFTKLHPGIQHKAGVPMGGTFILVYHSKETSIATGSVKGKFTIRGVVMSDKDSVLPGATLQIANTAKSVVTSAEGKFQLHVTELPITLLAKFAGFEQKEIIVSSEELLTIVLDDDDNEIPEKAIDAIAEGTVIADFYLPYRCCSDCPPIQYVVKELQETTPVNVAPTANAGTDQEIALPTNFVTLNGTATDPDGTIASFSWSRLSGPGQPTIVTPNSAQTSVKDLVEGVYQFELEVKDDKGLVAKDVVLITVKPAPIPNKPPVVDAGNDQSIILVSTANFTTLTGTATDPEGGPLTIAWTKVSGPGSQTIVSPGSLTTIVQGLQAGVYVFSLKATDNKGDSTSDAVTVTVTQPNKPPIVNAGNDQTIIFGATATIVTLAGTASDSEGGPITTEWSRLSGPGSPNIVSPASLTTPVQNLQVGVYVFSLKATDDKGASASDTIIITVIQPNRAPVAVVNTVPPITLPTNFVTLNGSSSSDPDGDPLTFEWTFSNGPLAAANIIPTIVNPTSAITQVIGLAQGNFIFKLTVKDDKGLAGTTNVAVIVNPAPAVAKVCGPLSEIIGSFNRLQSVDQPGPFNAFKEVFASYKDVESFFKNLSVIVNDSPDKQIDFFTTGNADQLLIKWLRELFTLSLQNSDLRLLTLSLYRILVQLAMYIECIQKEDFDVAKVPMAEVFSLIANNVRRWAAAITQFTPAQKDVIKKIGEDMKKELVKVNANGEKILKAKYVAALEAISKLIDNIP